MKRRFSAILLCLCLLLPVTALAADGDTVYVGGVALSGNAASPAYATTNNAGEVITDGATADNYNIKWDGSTLTLKDATIKKALPYSGSPPGSLIAGAAIGVYNQSGNAELTIQLEGQNTLSDTSTGIYVYSPDNGGEASLTITGSGSLTANSTSNSAIQVQSNSHNATLTIRNVDVTATATYGDSVCVQSGKNSNAALTVNGGSMTASGDPGIQYSFGGDSVTGTPSLTVSDNALVDARGGGIRAGDSSSAQQVTPTGSSGIVFDGSEGTVYGNVTLQEDLIIGAGETLTVPNGASLDTNGKLTVDGGTLNGAVTGNVIYKVTSVTLNKTSLALTAGETATLTATITPDNATNKTVTWISSDDNVATVNNGTVNAVSAGSATITATATDGSGKFATCVVTVNAATVITTQPGNAIVTEGETATFAVAATGSNLTYQWQQSTNGSTWTDISGATAATYTTSAAAMSMNGYQYRCVVTGDGGVATSNAATLTVNPTQYSVTVITDGNGMASATPTSGATGTEVTLTAVPNVGYQFKEWQVVSGGVTVTGGKFTIGTANVEIKAIFEAVHEHTFATTLSYDASNHWYASTCGHDVTSGLEAHHGGTATCIAQAVCENCQQPYGSLGTHTYGNYINTDADKHWKECSCGLKAEEGAHVYTNDQDTSCNTCGYIRVPVANPPKITKQPMDQYVVEGQRAEFSVEATGDGLTYQWYINRNNGNGWRKLNGAIGTAYVTSVTDLDCDGFQYGCLITDQYGNTLQSDVAVLHVSKVPVLPETGDSSTPMLWLTMSVLSMLGILLLRKKAYSR